MRWYHSLRSKPAIWSRQEAKRINTEQQIWDHITKLGEYEHHVDPMPSGGCIGIKSQPGLHGMLTEVN